MAFEAAEAPDEARVEIVHGHVVVPGYDDARVGELVQKGPGLFELDVGGTLGQIAGDDCQIGGDLPRGFQERFGQAGRDAAEVKVGKMENHAAHSGSLAAGLDERFAGGEHIEFAHATIPFEGHLKDRPKQLRRRVRRAIQTQSSPLSIRDRPPNWSPSPSYELFPTKTNGVRRSMARPFTSRRTRVSGKRSSVSAEAISNAVAFRKPCWRISSRFITISG